MEIFPIVNSIILLFLLLFEHYGLKYNIIDIQISILISTYEFKKLIRYYFII